MKRLTENEKQIHEAIKELVGLLYLRGVMPFYDKDKIIDILDTRPAIKRQKAIRKASRPNQVKIP